jgi:hypothetical protein
MMICSNPRNLQVARNQDRALIILCMILNLLQLKIKVGQLWGNPVIWKRDTAGFLPAGVRNLLQPCGQHHSLQEMMNGPGPSG